MILDPVMDEIPTFVAQPLPAGNGSVFCFGLWCFNFFFFEQLCFFLSCIMFLYQSVCDFQKRGRKKKGKKMSALVSE